MLYSSLNVKELLAQNKRDICSLSDSNRIRIHNQLDKLSKWLSCVDVVSTYLYGAFDCMLLSCHTRVTE